MRIRTRINFDITYPSDDYAALVGLAERRNPNGVGSGSASDYTLPIQPTTKNPDIQINPNYQFILLKDIISNNINYHIELLNHAAPEKYDAIPRRPPNTIPTA